jgi:hypothetical protein
MATKESPVTRAAGAAAWAVADLVRAELDTGSSTDVVRFMADRLALHIASAHIGEADDCNICTQKIWRETMQQQAARRAGIGPG